MIKYLLLFFIEAKRKYIEQSNSKDSPFGPAFATKIFETYLRIKLSSVIRNWQLIYTNELTL